VAVDVKPRSNRLLMVIGIIVALVAFVLVVILGSRGTGGTSGDRNIDVVVAAVDIPAGTQVTDQLVKTVKFASDQVPTGAHTQIKDASGQYAAVTLTKGTVLTGSNLVNTQSKLPAQKKPFLDIPSGQVAVSIPYGAELQAVGGFIQEGDKIDVLYMKPPTDKVTSIQVKTTLQNLVVQKVGPQTGSTGGTGGNTSAAATLPASFVVFVPVDQAEDLTFLFASGQYKLVLKSQNDITKNDVANTSGVTQPSFDSKYNVP
jgi:Flp pilus assembly protein CpaB